MEGGRGGQGRGTWPSSEELFSNLPELAVPLPDKLGPQQRERTPRPSWGLDLGETGAWREGCSLVHRNPQKRLGVGTSPAPGGREQKAQRFPPSPVLFEEMEETCVGEGYKSPSPES